VRCSVGRQQRLLTLEQTTPDLLIEWRVRRVILLHAKILAGASVVAAQLDFAAGGWVRQAAHIDRLRLALERIAAF
jgi:hypothetical protein